MKTCCICGKEFDGYGNNPEPIDAGTCCDKCNIKYVVPLRFHNIDCSVRFIICQDNETFTKKCQELREHNAIPDGVVSAMCFYHNSKEQIVLIPTYSNF